MHVTPVIAMVVAMGVVVGVVVGVRLVMPVRPAGGGVVVVRVGSGHVTMLPAYM
ncbi:hypothetical protein GCM10027053_39870 [Intrasporangium mesophilum]